MAKKLVWVSNTSKYNTELNTPVARGQSVSDAIAEANRFRNSFIEGRLQASSAFTVEELESKGLIGLYKEVDE